MGYPCPHCMGTNVGSSAAPFGLFSDFVPPTYWDHSVESYTKPLEPLPPEDSSFELPEPII